MMNGPVAVVGTLDKIAGGADPLANGDEREAVGTTLRPARKDRQAVGASRLVHPPVLRPEKREARTAGSQPAFLVRNARDRAGANGGDRGGP